LKPMIGGVVNLRVIEENWAEVLRLAASTRAGTVAPSALMRRLAAYPRQNALAKALREIGCIERTLFTLDWITDPALRPRSNAGLNKGEARNALARAVFFHWRPQYQKCAHCFNNPPDLQSKHSAGARDRGLPTSSQQETEGLISVRLTSPFDLLRRWRH